MKTFWNIVGALAILMLVIALMQTCQQSRDQSRLKEAAIANNERYLKKIAHIEYKSAMKDTLLAQERINRSLDSLNFKRGHDKDTRTIAALRARERSTRHDTVTLTLVDTIYAQYDSALKRCADYVVEQDSSYLREIRLLNDKLLFEHEKFVLTLADRDSLLNRPEKPTSSLAIGLSAGYGLQSSGGQVRAGIIFGPTVTYKIPVTWPRWMRRR